MKKIASALGLFILALLLMPAFVKPPADPSNLEGEAVHVTGARLVEAFADWREKYGGLPPGSTPAEMIRALRGENEKEKAFFECPAEAINETGELLDPWGTPFKIVVDEQTQIPRVHSAGPNHLFEADDAPSSDDYRSWLRAGP